MMAVKQGKLNTEDILVTNGDSDAKETHTEVCACTHTNTRVTHTHLSHYITNMTTSEASTHGRYKLSKA